MADVVIIGGGVIGLSTAYEAAGRGLSVVVLEQSQLGREASWAGAGILPPAAVDPAGAALEPMFAASSRLWPELSESLRDSTGIDNGYRRCGGITFPMAGEDLPVQRAALNGLGIEVELLDTARCRDCEPGIAAGAAGPMLHVPAVAQVRNPRHLQALIAACAARGVELRTGQPVLGFERGSGGRRIAAVRTASERITGGKFVVASGAWSRQVLAAAGCRLEVQPVRGQMVLLAMPRPPVSRVLECGPRYVVPRPDGRVLIGSTEEWVGFDKSTTAGAIAGLIEFGCALVPALREARLEQTWAGLRPHVPRGRPCLGIVPDCPNLIVATGHFRGGITLSPITGTLAAQLLAEEPLDLPIDAFALEP